MKEKESDPQEKYFEVITSFLVRQNASIQALRALSFALIQTHHDHAALLEKFLSAMDVVADTVSPDSIPVYREELEIYQRVMLDLPEAKRHQ